MAAKVEKAAEPHALMAMSAVIAWAIDLHAMVNAARPWVTAHHAMPIATHAVAIARKVMVAAKVANAHHANLTTVVLAKMAHASHVTMTMTISNLAPTPIWAPKVA